MPYNYSPTGPAVSENLEPITAPAVNKYFYPRGADTAGGSNNGLLVRHVAIQGIMYVPFKMASAVSVDRLAMNFVNLNSCVNTWSYDTALYTNNATDNYPATKIADLGTFSIIPGTTSPGVIQLTINQTLQANTVYWLAIGIRTNVSYPGADVMAGRTPIMPQLTGDFSLFRKGGISAGNSSTGGIAWAEQIPSYSGTLPASTTYASNQSQFSTVPRLAFRRSA